VKGSQEVAIAGDRLLVPFSLDISDCGKGGFALFPEPQSWFAGIGS
jgi:hypothetical protein